MTTKRLVIACVLAAAAAAAAAVAADERAPNVRGRNKRGLSDNSSGYEYDNEGTGNATEGHGNVTDGYEWDGNHTEGDGWGGNGFGGNGWNDNATEGHEWGGGGGWSNNNETEGHGWGGDASGGYGWNRNKSEDHGWNGTQGYGWNGNKTDGDGWGGNQSEGGGGFGHGENDHGGGGRGQGAFRQFFASVFNSLFGGGQGEWGSGGGSWGGSGDEDSSWGGHGGWGWGGDGDGIGGCRDGFEGVNFTTRNCSTSTGIPECTFSREGGTGTLVCRTLFSRFTGAKETSTECIDPEKSLPLDECGCCGDVCPQACSCACDSHDGSAGVQVLKIGETGEGFCVPTSYATTLLVRGKVECATNCTATGGNNTSGADNNGTAVVATNDTAA